MEGRHFHEHGMRDDDNDDDETTPRAAGKAPPTLEQKSSLQRDVPEHPQTETRASNETQGAQTSLGSVSPDHEMVGPGT